MRSLPSAGVRAPKQWLPCSISLSISTIVVLNGTTSSCIPWISNNGSDRPAEKVIGEFLLRKRTRLTLKLSDNAAAHEMQHADKRGAPFVVLVGLAAGGRGPAHHSHVVGAKEGRIRRWGRGDAGVERARVLEECHERDRAAVA